MRYFLRKRLTLFLLIFFSPVVFLPALTYAAANFSAQDLLSMKYVTSAQISPDGAYIAYTVRVPRAADEKPGYAYSEFYVLDVATGQSRPFITGKVNVSSLQWRPDGKAISFRMARGEKAKTQVWQIPIDGGEARPITHSKTGVGAYRWHPSGKKIAYIAGEPPTAREKALKEKGYDFIYYEEEWKHRHLFLQDVTKEDASAEPQQLTDNITVLSFVFSPDGKQIAFAGTEKNLIDYRYMFTKVYLLEVDKKEFHQLTDNPGKLGNYAFSPDGKHLAYAAASRRSDHAVSQVYALPVSGGKAANLTIPNFKGHVNWVGWKDNETIIYRSGEGVNETLRTVSLDGNDRDLLLTSADDGIIFSAPTFTKDFKHFAFVGQSPYLPGEVFYWRPGKKLRQLSTANPWLADKKFGKQEVIRYKARDGVEIEGLLIYPVDYKKGETYPLVVFVHGGPESHYSNAWVTRYSTPGQIMAGKGYAIFYPNYRASTGYGVEFAMKWHYGNAAGTEFDDVADGIDYLVKEGIADKERVGLGGGSYGGFAAAWFGTYYTDKVRAVCMFVGISDLISKRSTTDIPYEELYVHSGKKLEEMWDQSLKRSPIYYAHQSKSAFLIFGGAADTRVHPSQSLEMYRRLKMNDHPAVRLVQYPGEGHGNGRQPGRIDVLYRVMDWYDWYVKDKKPLDGSLPPLDISDKYGLELPE
ncbi:MAG TPA: S9 family peptidase [Caldithrix abyssi]|uniref:S9 family peptidase n=1 Tax=Caldithrix abyssi TaxID=187145 RepID=A0A7V4WUH3_CALAY|nr:S9 family peptidase [Caldithrix abyssi]